jgi:hypothetical protein
MIVRAPTSACLVVSQCVHVYHAFLAALCGRLRGDGGDCLRTHIGLSSRLTVRECYPYFPFHFLWSPAAGSGAARRTRTARTHMACLAVSLCLRVLLAAVAVCCWTWQCDACSKADKDGAGELSLVTFRKVMKESALLRDKEIDQVSDQCPSDAVTARGCKCTQCSHCVRLECACYDSSHGLCVLVRSSVCTGDCCGSAVAMVARLERAEQSAHPAPAQ